MSGFAIQLRCGAGRMDARESRRLAGVLALRAPDAAETWSLGPLTVVTALLETGDDRLRARVAVVDDRWIVAGQVRLDDREQLVAALVIAGQRARVGDPDIALFARAWAAWGEPMLDRVLGDFSAAIHDRESGDTLLVRDPLGVRLLYWARTPERFVASNTLACVLVTPGVGRELDDDSLAEFVSAGMIEQLDHTVYRDVRRVQPGHVLVVRGDGDVAERRYWQLPQVEPAHHGGGVAEGFLDVLDAAVRDRVRAPAVSIAMSSGLDSTALAALARRGCRASCAVHAVTTDSGTAGSEAGLAADVARFLGVEHHVVPASRGGYLGWIGSGVRFPEPVDEPDLGLWQASLQEAALHARVMLYGEDPDALLAPPDLRAFVAGRGVARAVADVLGHVLRTRSLPHLGVRDAFRRPPSGFVPSPTWLRSDLAKRRGERLAAAEPHSHATHPRLARALAHPLWQAFLESLDAGVHGVALDVRHPYLDLRVIRYAMGVDPLPWRQGKWLLREAMRGLLPDAARTAPKRTLSGYQQSRLTAWWATHPSPFVPGERLASVIDVASLPPITSTSPVDMSLVHLRLRLLDRWLRDEAGVTP